MEGAGERKEEGMQRELRNRGKGEKVEGKNIYPAGKRQYEEGTVPMKRKRRNYPIGRQTTRGFSYHPFSDGT